VKRLAVGTHCLASAGIPLALLQEAHLRGTVKRLTVRTHRLAVTGLRRSRTDREAKWGLPARENQDFEATPVFSQSPINTAIRDMTAAVFVNL
jgi:hypothetical protein